jgi:hypothetical protein
MGAQFVSIAFTLVATLAAFFAAPKGDYGRENVVAIWALSAIVVFSLPAKWMVFGLMAAAMAVCCVLKPAYRVGLYLGVMAVIPSNYDTNVPFPGINYLIELDYGKIATLVILGPLFFAVIAKPAPKFLRSVDYLLLGFVLLCGVMSIRELPLTSMLRSLFDLFVKAYLPYIAITRTMTSMKDVAEAVKAMFVGLVAVAVIGFISAARSWNYYANILDFTRAKIFGEYRNGILRISSTMNSTLLGVAMGGGVLQAYHFMKTRELPTLIAFGAMGLFAFVCFATGSRGAWLGALAMPATLFIFTSRSTFYRRAFVAASVLVTAYLYSDIVGGQRTFDGGNIDYRAELLRVGVQEVAKRPLFGSPNFADAEAFQALRQGEGIIDIVNAYLQYALLYGLTGLLLFVSTFVLAIGGAMKAIGELDKAPRNDDVVNDRRRLLAVLVSMMVGQMILLVTTSTTSYISNYNFMLLGMVVGAARFVRAETAAAAEGARLVEAEPEPSATPTGAVTTSPDTLKGAPPRAAAGARKPYGARFVR